MNQLPPNFNLNDARDMDCECGGKSSYQVTDLKKLVDY